MSPFGIKLVEFTNFIQIQTGKFFFVSDLLCLMTIMFGKCEEPIIFTNLHRSQMCKIGFSPFDCCVLRACFSLLCVLAVVCIAVLGWSGSC